MVSKIKNFVVAAVVAVAGFALIAGAPASASSLTIQDGIDAGKTANTRTELFGDSGIFTTIVNVMLFLIGALSVIMLIYGGIRYTISRGDSGEVNNAKNTILYAIVGLIVAILAYAIVNWVVKSFQE